MIFTHTFYLTDTCVSVGCVCGVCVGVWVSYTRINVAEQQATFADARLTFPDFFIAEVGCIERPLKEVLNTTALGM